MDTGLCMFIPFPCINCERAFRLQNQLQGENVNYSEGLGWCHLNSVLNLILISGENQSCSVTPDEVQDENISPVMVSSQNT